MFKELFNVKVWDLELETVNKAIEKQTSEKNWFKSRDQIAQALVNGDIEYYDQVLYVFGDVN